MKKRLLTSTLLVLSAMLSVPITAWADIEFGSEEKVNTTTTWTFGSLSDITQICQIGSTELYARANSQRGIVVFGESAVSEYTFSDGHKVSSLTHYACIQDKGNRNTTYTTTAGAVSSDGAANSNNVACPSIAFNATIPGTLYVYISKSGGKAEIRFYDGSSSPSQKAKTNAEGDEIQELKCTTNSSGVFFIAPTDNTFDDINIYAIRFVAAYQLNISRNADYGSFTVKKTNASGSTISNGNYVEENSQVYVSATPYDGYYLNSITYTPENSSETEVANGSTFTMPAAVTSLRATFAAKEAPTYAAPAYSALTYNGSAQNLVSAGSTEDGTINYSTSENGEYSTTIPTGTDAGNYTVYWKLEGDATHNDVAATAVDGVSIAKYNIENATIDGSIANQTYTGSALTPDAPAIKMGETTISSADYEVSYSNNTDVGTATVTYTAKSGSTNFTGTKTLNFTIEAAAVTPVLTVTQPASGGSITASTGGSVAAGTEVTLTATPASGYQLSGWKNGNDESLGSLPQSLVQTITMPSSDLTVTAEFTQQPTTIPTITGSKSWTFDTFAAGTILSYKDQTFLYDGLYLSGHAADKPAIIQEVSPSVEFSLGGENFTVSRRYSTPGGQNNDLASNRAASAYTQSCVAFKAGVAGTVYVSISGDGASGRKFNIYVNGTKNEFAQSGTGHQEISQSVPADGTVFISTSGSGTYIYAVKFVEATAETVGTPSISQTDNTITITGGTSSLESDVTTYYTTDGNDPTSSSTQYSAPFEITETCTVKAITISSGGTSSDVASKSCTYTSSSDAEKTVSTATTWTFESASAITSVAEVANGLYNRSSSSGNLAFTFESIDSQNLKFTDGESVTVTKIAKSNGSQGSSLSNSYLTAGKDNTSNTPMFAINTTVPGTFYALVKNGTSENDKIRLLYGKINEKAEKKAGNTGANLQELKYKATDEGGGVFFIGGVAGGVEAQIYAIRFVPSTYKYAITLPATDANGNKVTADKASAAEGETVTLTVTPASGYQLKSGTLKVNNGDVAISGSGPYTFTMPAKPVTVTAEFETTSATTYGITKGETSNGSFTVTVDGNAVTEAAANAEVTITATPASDSYEVDAVTVKDADNGDVAVSGTGNTRTFTMPAKAVTVTVTFKAKSSTPVAGDYWNVNDVTVGTKYTTLAQLDDAWVHVKNGREAEIKSESGSGSFSNNVAYSVSKFLLIQGGADYNSGVTTDNIENAATSRLSANGTTLDRDYLAMDVSQPGTLYVIYKPNSAASERNVYVGFQKASDNTYSKNSKDATSAGFTELTHTADAAGTFYIYGSIAVKIYAVMFVPNGTSYALTTVVDPAEAGSITRKFNNQETTASQYASGSSVSLTATVTPGAAYEFTKWTNEGGTQLSTDNPYTVTMDEAKTVKAVFSAVTSYTLTATANPTAGGTIITKIGTDVTEATSFSDNTVLTLTAKHKAGYKFTGWSGASTSTDPTISLTMNGDKTLTANFEAVDVYGTYDFKTWASSNVTSSTGLVTVTWDEGDLVADGNTMTLNNAFTAGGNVKIRNNGSSTGLIMQDNAHDNLKLNALTEGNWFKISCSEGALKFASTNVKKLGATANVTTDDYVVSDEIYVVTSGTGVDLTFGGVKYFTGSGSHSYIYTIQVSNAAIPPSVVFKEFSGDNAVYTVTYDATSTLYYKLPGASDYTSTTEGTESGGMKTIDLTATESGTLEVYSKKNNVDTEHVTVAVSLVKNVTLTLDETESDNTKKVYKVTGFKGGQTLYFQRPQDTKVNSTTNKVESGVATYTDDNPYTLTATDNGELTYYVKENGVESQHATITINTIIARPNAALKTLGEEKSVYTLTFKAGNTVTYKVPGGSDKTVSEGNSLDIDIPQSGQLIAYATMGSLKSDSLKTNVYVKTPSIVANGKYDFALLKDKIADYVLGTRPGEEVTVGDLTLKKPDDVVENTLNRFAFTARYTEKASNGTDRQRDTDWRLLSAGRLRANKGTVADTMAILNLTKGQYLSIEYSGADLKYMSQSTAKLAEGTDVLKSKQAYEILSDGALLLVVPANADKTCDIFVIEVAGDETVTAPTLEARTENGAVVPNAVTLRLGTSNFGNTVTAYYTTDGTTPAANNGTAMTASGKITVDVSCTIKAICISSSGVKSGIAEYKIDLTQAGQSPSAVYNFADMVAKGDTLQFSKTATSTVYNMEKSGSTWEVKGRSDFYRVTNLDSNNKISVRVGSGSLTYDTTAGTLQLKRAMAIHDLGVGDEVVIMYSGTGSLINVNSDRGDEFTVDGKTVAVGEEISSGKTIKITGTKYGNNYIVVNASGTVYINAIYINRSAPSTVTRPKIELREVGTETARYRITFDDGARLYYVLEKEGAERRGSDNGTFDLTIDESDRISAWAVKSGVSSDTLTTVIYAPTPAPSEAGDYDFYEPGSELPADLEVTLDPNKSVTVDGQTLYKPTAMTAQTFNDKFAFTETNTSGKIKIRTNRTLAFNKGTDMNMALLNMRRGDIISFDYTGSIRFANSAVVSQDGGSAARTRAESADGSKMVSGAAYVVQQDGNVLLNLELADNAITVAKMYVNAAPDRSKAAAIDFASALEEEEEVDMEGAAGVWCNERDAMVKFIRFANNSDELPINNKVSTENGYGTLEMNGFTSGNRNIAIHSLAKGDTIKVRFSGGDVFYYGHATYGNRVSVNGKTLQPGDAIKSGDVLKVEKVDYLNNYVVLRLGSKAAISGIFINTPEVEKVIRPTITTKANNTFTIMAGISTIGAKVTTCYTTNGTEPTLFNGTSGPYDSFDVQVLRGQNMTIKAISYSETGVVSKVMSVYYNGVDLTPIDDIMIDPSEQDDQQDKVIYDLMGRRVQTPQPGRLYIINGKKVIYNKR